MVARNKKKNKKRFKTPKKGFTLIELLAVIVILGLLLAIAIPSITKYITESRKKTLVTTIGNYIGAISNQVNDMEYIFTESNVIYAVPIECVALERGGTDPFGEWYQANSEYWGYILIKYNDYESAYTYGFTFKDSAGYGLYPVTIDNLNGNGTQINTGLELVIPRTGNYLNVATEETWSLSGFETNELTRIKVLRATADGEKGDGQNTCTLSQKGSNYETIEEEKNALGTLLNNKTDTGIIFGLMIEKSKIETINTVNHIDVPTSAITSWDASKEGTGTIIAWITDEDGNDMYELYIGSENGKIILPADSSALFYEYTNVTNMDLKYLDTSKVTTMKEMFTNCNNLVSVDVSEFNTSKVTTMYRMFKNCYKLISVDVSRWDTSNVTNMQTMFYNCNALKSLDVSNWNTQNLTNIQTMFYQCNNLMQLDVSRWNTSKVTTMYGTFENCEKITTLDVSRWDTNQVTTMQNLFKDMKNVDVLNVSNFNTSKVTDMSNMFKNCSKLTTLNISHFDTSNVTNMYAMFYGVNGITSLNVKDWNTANVENMRSTFSVMNLTEIDLSGWDTSKVTNMQTMFAYSTKLKKIDFRNANIQNVRESNNIFNSNPSDIVIIVKDITTKNWVIDKLEPGKGIVKTISEL